MKARRQLTGLLIFAAALSFMTGCATRTTGIERAERTTTSIAQVESDINQMVSQIDAANASLNDIMTSGGTSDVQKAFSAYSEDVKKLDETANTFMKHSNQMTAKGNDYFEEWKQSGDVYTDPRIQSLSQERRNELRESFNDISEASVGVKGEINNYVSNIKQIQTFLSTDLSPKGIDAISTIAQKTINDGNQIRSQVQPMLAEAAEVRAALSPGGAAAGGASPSEESSSGN